MTEDEEIEEYKLGLSSIPIEELKQMEQADEDAWNDYKNKNKDKFNARNNKTGSYLREYDIRMEFLEDMHNILEEEQGEQDAAQDYNASNTKQFDAHLDKNEWYLSSYLETIELLSKKSNSNI